MLKRKARRVIAESAFGKPSFQSAGALLLRRGSPVFCCDGLACRAVVRSSYEKLYVVARLRFTSTRQPSFSVV